VTAEERELGGARLRNKLLKVQQELAIYSDQANELSQLLADTAQTILQCPSHLQLSTEEITKISGVQELANKIRRLEQEEEALKAKAGKFP